MNLSAHSNLNSGDAKSLRNLLNQTPSGDLLAVCASTSKAGEYAWISRKGNKTKEGCGGIIGSTDSGVTVSNHNKKVFSGDRLEFTKVLDRLTEQEEEGWTRSTFVSDCRLSAAEGLYDEQAWCEAAYDHDGRPSEHTAYVVHVLGSENYFAYFNFKWVPSDPYMVKSCHDLKKWASAYVPRMYSERDVERWVFLCKEDFETFGRIAGEYRRAFTFMDYSFEVFRAGGTPQLTSREHQSQPSHQGERSPSGSGLRAVLQSALGRFGLSTAETWTSSDQAMVGRLVTVFAAKPSGPIDMTKSPSALPKLKALLSKRLKLGNVPPNALTRDEAIELYLDLSRFYVGWDKVSCEALFSDSNRQGITIDRLLECLTDDKAQDRLDNTRHQFAAELASSGIVVDKGA